MLWTFHRGSQVLHYEIRRADDSSEFELIVYHPDGQQTCERFADSAALNQRTLQFQQSLLDDGWFVTSNPRR